MATSNAAYVSFAKALAQMFDDAGVEYQRDATTETGVVENAKWVDFIFQTKEGPHKLYVPKNKGAVGRCHTTILFDSKIEGVLDLPTTARRPEYRNGAIRSHLSGSDPERVARMVIEAIKRGAPVPQKRIASARQTIQSASATPAVTPAPQENWGVSEEDVATIDAGLSFHESR